MNLFKKVYFVLDNKQKIRLIQLFFIIIVGTFLELVGVTAILPFINVIMAPDTISSTWYLRILYKLLKATTETDFLIKLALMLVVIYVAKNVYMIMMYKLQYQFTYNNQERLAKRLLFNYIHQDYLFQIAHNSGEMLRNIQGDASTFFTTILTFLQLFTEICVCLTLIIFLFIMDKTITVSVSIIMMLFVFILYKYLKERMNRFGRGSREHISQINKWILQAFGGIKEIKVLEKENYFVEKFGIASMKFAEDQYKYMLYLVMPKPLMEAICISGLLIVVAFKLMQGVYSAYFISTLSVFAVAAFRLLPSFNRITSFVGTLMYSKSSVDSVYNDLKSFTNIKIDKPMLKGQYNLDRNITVDHVFFSYPASENVLEDINMVIPKNTSIALVGPSGAGKTTLADIILGLLYPQKGRILVDDNDIQNDLSAWHHCIGYIPQTIYIIDDTLRNNIALGIESNAIDEIRLKQAIKDSQLDGLLQQLPQGLDTILGECGIRLSGGQKQRVGIARALYLDPKLLILDEATSALDNDTEAAIMEAIDNLSGKKTLIIIAHRLTTIKNCDYVYEIKDKTIQLK